MSGKIELKVRLGKSLDPRYDKYPEGFIEVTDENGKDKVKLSPSYPNLMNLLIAFRRHELKVDLTRERKNYTSKLIEHIEKTLEILKNIELSEFDKDNIEEIYKKPKMK